MLSQIELNNNLCIFILDGNFVYHIEVTQNTFHPYLLAIDMGGMRKQVGFGR